jgi:hypothetical protein
MWQSVDRLLWRITSKNNKAEWESLGRRIENILSTFPNAFPIGRANRLIRRMVGGAETGWWGEKEIELLVNAARGVRLQRRERREIPSYIIAEFCVNWLALVSFLRHGNRKPGVTEFATALCPRVLSEVRVRQPFIYDLQLDCLKEIIKPLYDVSSLWYRPTLTLELLQRLSKGVLVVSNVGWKRESTPAPQGVQQLWTRAKRCRVDGRLCNLFGPGETLCNSPFI